MSSFWVYAVWSLIAGALIPVLAANNGTLGRVWGSPVHASLAVAVLMICAVLLVLLTLRPAVPDLASVRSAPPMAYVGGLIMAFYVLSATFLSPRFGVGNFVMCVVIAQLVMSTLIDQFGWFGAPVQTVDMKRLMGLAMLGAGAVLVALK